MPLFNGKDLTHLDLGGTLVSDAGLSNFKDCKNLTQLALFLTKVSDADLAHFKDWKNGKNLTYLHLEGTQVSNAGLAHLKDCKKLKTLMTWPRKVERNEAGKDMRPRSSFSGCREQAAT